MQLSHEVRKRLELLRVGQRGLRYKRSTKSLSASSRPKLSSTSGMRSCQHHPAGKMTHHLLLMFAA